MVQSSMLGALPVFIVKFLMLKVGNKVNSPYKLYAQMYILR